MRLQQYLFRPSSSRACLYTVILDCYLPGVNSLSLEKVKVGVPLVADNLIKGGELSDNLLCRR
jgi:hypothetical protein